MNALIKNSVKQLEWRLTILLREEIGKHIQYDWKQSPVRVLRGQTAQFLLEDCSTKLKWDGEVKVAGNGQLIIELLTQISQGRKIEQRFIQLIG